MLAGTVYRLRLKKLTMAGNRKGLGLSWSELRGYTTELTLLIL